MSSYADVLEGWRLKVEAQLFGGAGTIETFRLAIIKHPPSLMYVWAKFKLARSYIPAILTELSWLGRNIQIMISFRELDKHKCLFAQIKWLESYSCKQINLM
jgi:hypothetical protein